jgi:dTDP-4-dehydrorhamnose 3,5-epimerase
LKIIETGIPGLVVIQPRVFTDERGYFFESYRLERFREIGINPRFVQDNESMSVKDVLRGLHLQTPPHSQAKLVRVARGSVQDVALDLRKGSPTYGKWYSAILNAKEKKMMFIPEGFAHGFLTLENNTIFQYKCSNYYHRASEATIIWNDPDLGIDWNCKNPIISEKDLRGNTFQDFQSPFIYSEKQV